MFTLYYFAYLVGMVEAIKSKECGMARTCSMPYIHEGNDLIET